jgi:GNAT superfamily N-acetyltransferase
MQIRPFVPETDMAAMVAIRNQIDPLPVTVEEMWHRERSAPPDVIRRRLVALDEAGQVVGFAHAIWASYLPEGRFNLRVLVAPPCQGRGIGSALYEAILRLAREEGARELEGRVRESHPEALRFAQNRGFSIRRHWFESTLDLETFDETPFAGAIARAEAAGFRFFSFADIPDNEENRRRYYDLDMETSLDIPGYELKAIPFAEWQALLFQAQSYRADGQIIAAHGDRWAGVASVNLYPESKLAYNGFTGVRREFRGQHLATALKLLAIRMARQHGMARMRTNNDSENGPMLAINRKLGYVPEPGEYWLIQVPS